MSSETRSTPSERIQRSDTADGVPPRFQTSSGSDEVIDPHLIKETKNQIQALVLEIKNLAVRERDPAQFYPGFLARTISALASAGGAIWLKDERGQLQLKYHANLAQTGLPDNVEHQQQHARLLDTLVGSGEPNLVPPRSGGHDKEGGANPTEFLLVVGPITTEQGVAGLVEIFQRAGGGPTTQRGYLRFLVQMCEIASGYFKNQRLKEFQEQQQTWQRLETFVRNIHRGLDTRQTLYSIANEGRQFVQCDRVSVALANGRRCRIEAVSGLDTIERRAEQVKLLNRLTSAVTRAGTPLCYQGDDRQLPPQIETRLQEYIDQSHCKAMIILPLRAVDPQAISDASGTARKRRPKKQPLIGAVIFEQLSDDQISAGLQNRAEIVQNHASDALTNALMHNQIVLLPLLKTLGAVPGVRAARGIPKWIWAVAVAAAMITAMCVIPYEFTLAANGRLMPETRYEIFAPSVGILKEIHAPENPEVVVEAGDLLAVMTNNDLLVEIESLEGQLKTEIEQQKKLQRALAEKLDRMDQLELVGEVNKSIEAEKSIRRKLALRRQTLQKLQIRAPARGQVVNWQLRQNLIRRPVQAGQNLMTVVDPDSRWELEIELPEQRVAHLMRQQRESSDPVTVTFTLASHPGKSFRGTIVEIDRQLDVYSEDGNAALVRVSFDREEIPAELLKAGTRVSAKIHCGERSLGYVLFHELIETVQSKVAFWF